MMTGFSILLLTAGLMGAAVGSPDPYIEAVVPPYSITPNQIRKGLLILGPIELILLVLMVITWRMPASGWLPLALLLVFLGLAILPVLGLVGYGLSMAFNATYFAQRRALAQELDRDGVVVVSRLVKRWWGHWGAVRPPLGWWPSRVALI